VRCPDAAWFLRYCEVAGIPTATQDAEGRVIEHVDVHALRRTFATNLIVAGEDPETVRQLLGHKMLEMTVKICTTIHNQTKRQALSKLTYGKGSLAPEHIVEYPGTNANRSGFPVRNSHQTVTRPKETKAN